MNFALVRKKIKRQFGRSA